MDRLRELEKDLFDQALRLLERKYREIAGREPAKPTRAAYVSIAVTQIVGMGLRHLQAARELMDLGFQSESPIHIRTAWECGIDVNYLMAQGAGDRRELAEKYMAMSVLRMTRLLQETDPRSPEEWGKMIPWIDYRGLQSRYHGDKALRLQNHWSGEKKADIRKVAGDYIEKLAGAKAEGLARSAKAILFELGSAYAHADPAILFTLPLKKWRPLPGSQHKRRTPHALGALFAALFLLLPLCRRLGDAHFAAASELLDDVHEHLTEAQGSST